MNALLQRNRPPLAALVLLVLAAIAFVVGGVDHARLFHRGYAQVEVVGPLFLLNALGTLVVVLLLLDRRIRLFLGGVLSISLGSIVSILISHSSSFFGFAEGGYDTDATLILAAEIASVVLVLAAVAAGALRQTAPVSDTGPAAHRPGPLQLGLGVAVVLVLGLPIAGVATGRAPKNDPTPTGAQLAASKAAIKNGNAMVQEGKHLFEAHHCDTCHAIAATGAKGILGPRMDAQSDTAEEIGINITKPRVDIAEGFGAKLMPTDYASKMNGTQIKHLSAFIRAASTTGRKDGGTG
ncbi:MAG: Cytochrome c oxidase polypeptide [Solirubrobacterales bacterium]|nr:Cytochrome c oxidase polypeptide [Solirubrobacterales bacterium]